MKTFNYENKNYKVFQVTAFNHKRNVIVTPREYMNGTLALVVMEIITAEDGVQDLEPYGVLTVNIEHPLQDETHAFVKAWSENAQWADDLASQIGKPTDTVVPTGYVATRLWEFDLSKLTE